MSQNVPQDDQVTATANSEQEQLKRIYQATGCHTQEELAKILQIKQSSISYIKRIGKIPDTWLMKLLTSHKINPQWIQYGIEPQYINNCTDFSQVKTRKNMVSTSEETPENKLLLEILKVFPKNYLVKELSRRQEI